jgi:NAD(P)-dependent dehydrogenase (short-subunit alcohol dehydrogenase family)
VAIPWRYEGKRVVVSGGGGAGMGAAVVDDLVELGAEIHVLDLKEPTAKVAGFYQVDLRDPSAIDSAVAEIGGHVDALFNCAGLPGPPHSGLDTMLVNFVAARHLTERVVPLMDGQGAVATVSSAGGIGWEHMMDVIAELLATKGFDEARRWLDARPELVGEGYLFSKQVIIVWTFHAALDLAPQGIRVNCTCPGPTDTPMMPSFVDYMGQEFMDAFPKPLGGRNSTPQEQAHVLVFLNSDAASYMTGSNVYVDGGFTAGLTTGRLGL